MMIKYIRPASDVLYYVITLLFTIIGIVTFWFLSYLDSVNMLNNGYINKKSIIFSMEKINYPLQTNAGNYILFQYNEDTPQLKFVWLNGKVKFPPIKQFDDYTDTDNVAIIGEYANAKAIPSDYKWIGYFNAPNSYKLQSDIWLVSRHINIDVAKGTKFVFMTPSFDVMPVFNETMNGNNVRIIHSEQNGSYNLKSNQFVVLIQYITVFLMSIMLFITVTIWLNKESYFLSILYLYGYSPGAIYIILLKTKILPYIVISMILMILAFIAHDISPLWDISWLIYSACLVLFYIFLVMMLGWYFTFIYTVRKGGQKY